MMTHLFCAFVFISLLNTTMTEVLDQQQENQYNDLAEKLSTLEERVDTMCEYTVCDRDEKYAFTATLLTGQSDFLQDGQLIFPNVLTNVGGAYNEDIGTFRSPADGVYVFHYQSITSPKSYHCTLTLFKNSLPVVSAFSNSQSLTFGNTAIMELKAGDVIHVNIKGPMCHLRGGIFTTFSGYKI